MSSHPLRRAASLLLAGCLTLVAAGCDDDVDRAVTVSRAIRDSPERTEEILEEHEMTIEEFEALMYEVSADPEMAERYDEAMGSEGGEE